MAPTPLLPIPDSPLFLATSRRLLMPVPIAAAANLETVLGFLTIATLLIEDDGGTLTAPCGPVAVAVDPNV